MHDPIWFEPFPDEMLGLAGPAGPDVRYEQRESVESTLERVTRGRFRTSGGQSHSCDSPTSQSRAPNAATTSVAAGSSDTTRTP